MKCTASKPGLRQWFYIEYVYDSINNSDGFNIYVQV